MADDTILETRGLTKEFKGFVAVKDVSLTIRRGTIHALIGPNGAGKTTCFNLLTHFLTPRAARSSTTAARSPARGRRRSRAWASCARSRSPRCSRNLTVLENVRIALQRKRGHSFDFWRSESDARARIDERALRADRRRRPRPNSTTPHAVELPYGRKRALEIATTLALDPEMMLLDEPTAGMTHEDVERIAALISKVAANRTVLMVEHNLSVVSTLSDHITVLARGEVLAEGDYAHGVEASGRRAGLPGSRPCLTTRDSPRRAAAPPARRAAARGARPQRLVRRVARPARRRLRRRARARS